MGRRDRAQTGLRDRAGDRGARPPLHARERRSGNAAEPSWSDMTWPTRSAPMARSRACLGEGRARPGGRPPGDGRDGPLGGQGRSALGDGVHRGVPLAAPRTPLTRTTGRRPPLGARRAGRRVAGRVRPRRPRDGWPDRPARGGAAEPKVVALTIDRRDHVLVGRRPHAAHEGSAHQRRPRGAGVLRPARPGRLARPSAPENPLGGRPDGPTVVEVATGRCLAIALGTSADS